MRLSLSFDDDDDDDDDEMNPAREIIQLDETPLRGRAALIPFRFLWFNSLERVEACDRFIASRVSRHLP